MDLKTPIICLIGITEGLCVDLQHSSISLRNDTVLLYSEINEERIQTYTINIFCNFAFIVIITNVSLSQHSK